MHLSVHLSDCPSQNVFNLVYATSTILAESFWNFAEFFVKVWRCAWGLAVIIRLIFVTFLQFELSHFWLNFYQSIRTLCTLWTQLLLQVQPGLEVMKLEFILKLKIKPNYGCLRTGVCKQPIIALYFEFENELKFYNLKARSFWNFAGVFVKVWRCACNLDVILKLFLSFFCSLNFGLFVSPSVRVGRHIVLPCASDCLSQNLVCSRTWIMFEINLFINLVIYAPAMHLVTFG